MAESNGSFDPLARLREMLDRGERRANEILSEVNAREDVQAGRSRMSEVALGTQKRVWELWARYFQSINLPTRTDILRLGKRLGEVEASVARVEIQLRRLERQLVGGSEGRAAAASAAARPRRTRKPPAEALAKTEEKSG